jgi:hypothetical protein
MNSTIVTLAVFALLYLVWRIYENRKMLSTPDLSDERLMNEYIDLSQKVVRFYHKGGAPEEAEQSASAYRKIVAIDDELQRRGAKLKLLTPLLNDRRDGVRVITAALLARPNDERCIKILREVAERQETTASNVAMLARFFLDNIYDQQNKGHDVNKVAPRDIEL